MKVYDYKCLDKECGIVDERFVKDPDDFQFCQICGCEMEKMLSAPAMVKGNFYNDKCGSKK